MRAELLPDTGALVTLFDRSRPRHAEFVGFFEGWDGAVLSTEAVLTEASHLLGRVSGGAASCMEFSCAGVRCWFPARRPRCGALMS